MKTTRAKWHSARSLCYAMVIHGAGIEALRAQPADELKLENGGTRRFQPGDVLEVLDVAPSKGHTTWVGDEPAAALFSNRP